MRSRPRESDTFDGVVHVREASLSKPVSPFCSGASRLHNDQRAQKVEFGSAEAKYETVVNERRTCVNISRNSHGWVWTLHTLVTLSLVRIMAMVKHGLNSLQSHIKSASQSLVYVCWCR
jgi:hypothetical protein